MTFFARTPLLSLLLVVFCSPGENSQVGQDAERDYEKADEEFLRPSLVDLNCECGRPGAVGRIFGGFPVTPSNKYPFMAVIRKDGRSIQGGTLLNDRFVLTTARGLYRSEFSSLEVILGMSSRDSETSGAVKYEVKRYKLHGSFKFENPTSPFDIAVIRVIGTVTFTPNIQPICLPSQADTQYAESNYGVVLGWGSTNASPDYSDKLTEIPVKAISTYDCQATGIGRYSVQETICAGKVSGGSVLKEGDFGGPLVFNTGRNHVQMGIASFKSQDSLPDVYIYVRMFVKWIHKKTTRGIYCSNPIAKY